MRLEKERGRGRGRARARARGCSSFGFDCFQHQGRGGEVWAGLIPLQLPAELVSSLIMG